MLTVAWDVDDVLNDLMRSWLERGWKRIHPDCAISYEDLRENPPHRLLSCSMEEYLQSLDAFRLSEGDQLRPHSTVMQWFQSHGGRCQHIALTSVPVRCAPVSAAWVMRHFGQWIRSFHFVPSSRNGDDSPAYDTSKASFLSRSHAADVLVDDNEGNLRDVSALGLKVIPMPAPWNSVSGSMEDALAGLTEFIGI